MLGSTFIEFDDVEVPIGNLLGKENEGFGIIMNSKSSQPIPYAIIADTPLQILIMNDYGLQLSVCVLLESVWDMLMTTRPNARRLARSS